jgi:hypothetical protein
MSALRYVSYRIKPIDCQGKHIQFRYLLQPDFVNILRRQKKGTSPIPFGMAAGEKVTSTNETMDVTFSPFHPYPPSRQISPAPPAIVHSLKLLRASQKLSVHALSGKGHALFACGHSLSRWVHARKV